MGQIGRTEVERPEKRLLWGLAPGKGSQERKKGTDSGGSVLFTAVTTMSRTVPGIW